MDGIGIQYAYHVHSQTINSDTITFNTVNEATDYFAANPCESTSGSGGGCFGQYNEGHTHSNSCYTYTTCGHFRTTYDGGDGTGHFRCDGCGQIAYGSISSWSGSLHQKQVQICGKAAGNPYYSANCGYSHGELLSATITFN